MKKRRDDQKMRILVQRWFALASAISAFLLFVSVYYSLPREVQTTITAVAVLSWLAWYVGIKNGR